MASSLSASIIAPQTLTKRQRNELLISQLDSEYNSFKPLYRDLNDYILPTRGRFFVSDVNKGDRRNLKIIDSTGTMAARTLRAGMMSGVTSPARRWFKLATPDPDLNKFPKVKNWLYDVAEIMNMSFLRSNLYQTKPIVYGDIGTFGTGAYSVEENFDSVLHTQSFPIGSYRIAKDYLGRVNVFSREFRMTISQLVEEFGQLDKHGRPEWGNFSDYIKNQYEQGMYQTWVDVCHIIKPNDEFDPNRLADSRYKKFSSCYYERGSSTSQAGNYITADNDTYLSEKGFDYFPILVPRWEVTGEDVYGTDCPGITTIGDIKQLQWGEKRIAQAIDTLIKPPMKAPTSLRTVKASILPGDITYQDEREGQAGFKPIYQIDPKIQEMEMKQEQVRKRVKTGYYEDLFLMMANSDRRDITAREIDERHEEKLLALGPVMEQINQDDLDPLIDIAFTLHLQQRLLPPPPEELRGLKLSVEYISIMAQAQKMIGIGSLERFAHFSGQMIGPFPASAKKTNANKIIEMYGDMVSLPPGIVRSDEEVAAMEAQEQQAMQVQQRAQMMSEGAKAANQLANAPTDGDNALTRLMKSAQSGGVVPTA